MKNHRSQIRNSNFRQASLSICVKSVERQNIMKFSKISAISTSVKSQYSVPIFQGFYLKLYLQLTYKKETVSISTVEKEKLIRTNFFHLILFPSKRFFFSSWWMKHDPVGIVLLIFSFFFPPEIPFAVYSERHIEGRMAGWERGVLKKEADNEMKF